MDKRLRDGQATDVIIRHIYDAALDPGDWSELFGLLRRSFDSTAVGIFIQDKFSAEVEVLASEGFDDAFLVSYGEYYAMRNPWYQPECLMAPGRVLTDESIDRYYNEPGRYFRSEFYHDWVRPQQFDRSLGGTLEFDAGRDLNFTYFRPNAAGPYREAEVALHSRLALHIRQALTINRRLQLERLDKQISATVLEYLQCGVISLDQQLRIQYCNRQAERLLQQGEGLRSRAYRLVACEAGENIRLQDVLAQIQRIIAERETFAPFFLSIRRAPTERPLQLTLLPLTMGRDFIGLPQARVVILISDPRQAWILGREYLQQRYGLTAAEAGLAQLLAQGRDLKAAADCLQLRYETARSYLKLIFHKTGTHRQAELVHRLLTDALFSRQVGI